MVDKVLVVYNIAVSRSYTVYCIWSNRTQCHHQHAIPTIFLLASKLCCLGTTTIIKSECVIHNNIKHTGNMQSKKYANIKGSDLANGTLAVFFFLANGSCAMNSCCRNCYSSDWHRCPNPNCNARF